MTKTAKLAYLEALDAMKTVGCIGGHQFVSDAFIPDWLPGGLDRATAELASNPRPFGLKKSRRAYLMLLLPIENRKVIDEMLFQQILKQDGH